MWMYTISIIVDRPVPVADWIKASLQIHSSSYGYSDMARIEISYQLISKCIHIMKTAL